MNDDEQEFQAVLGPLFDELSALSPSTMNMNTILTETEKKKIRGAMYMVQMPVSGDYALDLASAVDDFADGCESCAQYLMEFAARFIYALWETIMISMEVEDE